METNQYTNYGLKFKINTNHNFYFDSQFITCVLIHLNSLDKFIQLTSRVIRLCLDECKYWNLNKKLNFSEIFIVYGLNHIKYREIWVLVTNTVVWNWKLDLFSIADMHTKIHLKSQYFINEMDNIYANRIRSV